MIAALEEMLEKGLLSESAARRVETQHASGVSLDDTLLADGGVDEETLLKYLSTEYDVPFVDLDSSPPEQELVTQFPARVLMTHRLLPLSRKDDLVTVASSRLFENRGIDELQMMSDCRFRLVLAPSADINRWMNSLLGVGADTLQSLVSQADEDGVKIIDGLDDDDVNLESAAQDASIIRFVNQILAEAIERKATDVHFEPFENELRVRYRVDGVLQEANVSREVRQFQPAIVSRLKILSRLDIAEKRLPQDGRIKLKVAGREIDIRVSVIPMLHGEAVALRVLDRSVALLRLEQLGMSADDSRLFEQALLLPHGIILVTGPTGSGKTTSLYSGLSQINDIDRKIITIEDPIEYHLRGVNQIQVATKSGLTFATGLRSILRHDPDVVLIGEIRDRETAEIAVQASLTGHLVFSTLHTNDAPGALTRLIDMGIEPYLVASSLEMVVAQRLVRLICQDCRELLPPSEIESVRSEFASDPPSALYRGRGCRRCQGSGYRGRTGIFEVMVVDESIRTMVLDRASASAIRQQAIRNGMNLLREDAWRLVRSGRTTIEEALRVTKDERVNGQ
jgi:general secretion pathway protein E/type IV pilus assembly protein PilB